MPTHCTDRTFGVCNSKFFSKLKFVKIKVNVQREDNEDNVKQCSMETVNAPAGRQVRSQWRPEGSRNCPGHIHRPVNEALRAHCSRCTVKYVKPISSNTASWRAQLQMQKTQGDPERIGGCCWLTVWLTDSIHVSWYSHCKDWFILKCWTVFWTVFSVRAAGEIWLDNWVQVFYPQRTEYFACLLVKGVGKSVFLLSFKI